MNVVLEDSAVEIEAEDITGRLDFVGACGEFHQDSSALIRDEHDYLFNLRGLS